MTFTERVYAQLPPWGRDLAASLRGLQLRATRYDRDLEARVEAALEREYWGAAEWQVEIDRRLDRVLDAARRTPYYRDRLASRRLGRDGLREVPTTPKADIQRDPGGLLVPGFRGRTVVDHTSGTTGTPLRMVYDREAVLEWYALTEARFRRWYGVDRSDRFAMFGGQVVVPVRRTAPPFWVHNRPMRQLYVSTHHISRRNASSIAEALCRFRPRYLLGYPAAMALLARYALEVAQPLPRVEVVLSNAEILRDGDRAVLESTFGAPVRNSYGMAEMAAGASECEHGSMHLWPEVGIVEALDPHLRVSAEPGRRGPLVLTGLLNRAMPLVRYEVGDVGSVPEPSECSCGRTLPVLGPVDGRTRDALIATDGRRVFTMTAVFEGLPIANAQIRQTELGRVEIDLVGDSGWRESDAVELIRRCRMRLGEEVAVELRLVETIPRDPSGKFRSVVSTVGAPP